MLNWVEKIRMESDTALKEVYQTHRNDITHLLMRRYQLSIAESKDLFQSAIIVLYENVVSGKVQRQNTSAGGYLRGIALNMASKYHRDHLSKWRLIDWALMGDLGDQETETLDEEELGHLERALLRLGERCREILVAFYYERRSMQEIAVQQSYANVNKVKSKKYQCLQKLRGAYTLSTHQTRSDEES